MKGNKSIDYNLYSQTKIRLGSEFKKKMSRPKKGAGTNKKGHSERNPRNIEKRETSDSSIERRPETKRHRPESASS